MIVLVELTNPDRNFVVAKRDWRPMLREIRKARLLNGSDNSLTAFFQTKQVSAPEAKAIGTYFASLLDHAELPLDIDLDLAERFAQFATNCEGFTIT